MQPTPVLGVVGLLEDAAHVLRRSFRCEGDFVYLLGETGDDLGGSEMLRVVHGRVAGRPPRLGMEAERGLPAFLAEGAAPAILLSPHDLPARRPAAPPPPSPSPAPGPRPPAP